MNFKRGLKSIGFLLIAIGIFIIIIQPFSTTGAAIDLSTAVSRIWFFIGLGLVVVGWVLSVVSGAKESKLVEITEEHQRAHNAANFQRLKEEYRFDESHGTSSTDPKAWVKMYHGFLATPGKKPDFSRLDRKKAGDGFYFTKSKAETYEVLRLRGIEPQDAEIVQVRISKNVYNPKNKRGIVKQAPSTEGDYYYIQPKDYKKANNLINKGLIKID